MTTALLGLYLLLVGFALPRRLARSPRLRAGLQARPVAGTAVWLALMASFGVALLLTVHHLAAPAGHEPAGLVGLLPHTEPVPAPARPAHGWWAPAAAALAAGGVAAAVGLRTARQRRRHREVLDIVARRDARCDALVLEDPRPTVYCLPGRHSRVVVSRGALELLGERQLAAAVAHERGHIRGRHHLVRAAVDAFALVLGALPLARTGRAEVALLLEMAADDAALAVATRTELASALCLLATGQPSGRAGAGVPGRALGAASTGVLPRVQRLARPAPAAPAAWRLAAASAPVLPYLLACAPHP
ncbi:M56 family metallopeptidase [Kitasatospora sp. NBC_01560]|uniref:M56 family metallopeptidase n=1 Tax=Kitasatospora sp. NBC_01560 TaxID=2975965 RepID=UPI00386514AF